MVAYIYKDGKFQADPSIQNLGRRAVTLWTGAVVILDNMTYNKNTKHYAGDHNGRELDLTPACIMEMRVIA